MIHSNYTQSTHSKCPRKCPRILQYLSQKNVICPRKIPPKFQNGPRKIWHVWLGIVFHKYILFVHRTTSEQLWRASRFSTKKTRRATWIWISESTTSITRSCTCRRSPTPNSGAVCERCIWRPPPGQTGPNLPRTLSGSLWPRMRLTGIKFYVFLWPRMEWSGAYCFYPDCLFVCLLSTLTFAITFEL